MVLTFKLMFHICVVAQNDITYGAYNIFDTRLSFSNGARKVNDIEISDNIVGIELY